MKTYTANDNCFLIDGEVYLVSKTLPPMIGWWCIDTHCNIPVYCSTENYGSDAFDYFIPITHSTKPLDGFKPLPRDKFVKPVDLKSIAKESAKIYYSEPSELKSHYKLGFKAGYNANPNEFTREEMIKGLNSVAIFASSTNNPFAIEAYINGFLDGLRPLSLPSQLEINEQGEIVNVIWR